MCRKGEEEKCLSIEVLSPLDCTDGFLMLILLSFIVGFGLLAFF